MIVQKICIVSQYKKIIVFTRNTLLGGNNCWNILVPTVFPSPVSCVVLSGVSASSAPSLPGRHIAANCPAVAVWHGPLVVAGHQVRCCNSSLFSVWVPLEKVNSRYFER